MCQFVIGQEFSLSTTGSRIKNLIGLTDLEEGSTDREEGSTDRDVDLQNLIKA